ncbi:alpha/beta fold hydrolase [Methanofollis fontis]|uniref:Alpha/beta hydrolase n=1 Tax=Methanofollis fontis TaxID=2052832 RepID=A0A483CSE2_9EURY|nr:alpha/beta hydrolase [Methanofollis fontis]TAJ43346.1 alpha/beta hydrolase [Methanofollis fontis]
MQMKSVPVDDIEIAYQEIGEGDPLVMITGSSATMDMWSPALLDALSRQRRLILFDNRGMGFTTTSDREFSIPLFAEDTVGLMDALGIERADIFGWSMGGYIAQELVLHHPERVNRMVLYAASPGGEAEVPPSDAVIAALGDTSGSPEEQGMRLLSLLFPREWMEQNPDPSAYFPFVTETMLPESIIRQNRACETWEGTASRLFTIPSPVLLITGTGDVIVPPENSYILGEGITDSWIVKVPGGGHGLMYQEPQKMAEIVQFFLSC